MKLTAPDDISNSDTDDKLTEELDSIRTPEEKCPKKRKKLYGLAKTNGAHHTPKVASLFEKTRASITGTPGKLQLESKVKGTSSWTEEASFNFSRSSRKLPSPPPLSAAKYGKRAIIRPGASFLQDEDKNTERIQPEFATNLHQSSQKRRQLLSNSNRRHSNGVREQPREKVITPPGRETARGNSASYTRITVSKTPPRAAEPRSGKWQTRRRDRRQPPVSIPSSTLPAYSRATPRSKFKAPTKKKSTPTTGTADKPMDLVSSDSEEENGKENDTKQLEEEPPKDQNIVELTCMKLSIGTCDSYDAQIVFQSQKFVVQHGGAVHEISYDCLDQVKLRDLVINFVITDKKFLEMYREAYHPESTKSCRNKIVSVLSRDLTQEESERIERILLNHFVDYDTAEKSIATRRSRRLSREDKNKVVLVYPDRDTIDSITITAGDLYRLGPNRYLNDNIIDFQFRYLFQQNPTYQKHFLYLTSHFYTKLTEVSNFEDAYENVKRWTLKTDIFSKDAICIPINLDLHWSLAIILRPNHESLACIILLDSLGNYHRKSKIARILRNFLSFEWETKKNQSDPYPVHQVRTIKPIVPKQTNGSDCGVYVLMYAEHFLQELNASTAGITKQDLDSGFNRIFHSDIFTSDQVAEKRLEIRGILESLK